MQADVLILGAGAAGLCAALSAAPRRTLLLCPDAPGRSSSSALAQGGIAAPVGSGDSVNLHVGDTVAAAGHSADPVAVTRVIESAADAIAFLERTGVDFDRDGAGHSLHLEAGHRRARVAHAAGDRSGEVITQALWNAVAAARHVDVLCGWRALDLLATAAGVGGVLTADAQGRPMRVEARETVLATGGIGRLFRYTTNGPYACGDGLAMALAAGARTAALEFVQFHPTALRVEADPLPLLTEALRGAGARLVTANGRHVMAARHPLGDLAPRDVVARAVFEHTQAGEQVLLDARSVFASAGAGDFPGARATALKYGFDPVHDLLPVTAAAHYHMGGLIVDAGGRTSIPGLWACGEVAYTGLHGANRLASNSLLEAVVCGRMTGEIIARSPSEPRALPPPVAFPAMADPESSPVWQQLRDRVWQALGPIRDGGTLQAALAATAADRAALPPEALILRRRFDLALAMLGAAADRNESRGAHWRRDYPRRDSSRDGPLAVHRQPLSAQ
ncbi:MAG: FAD-binding protein [Gammaproteobacteria bacterium]|nr:FAD-binding protein [Gammaproteobacteria bacterium]